MKNKSYLCKTTCLLLSMILLLFNVPIQVSSTEVESQKTDAVSNTDISDLGQQTEESQTSRDSDNSTYDPPTIFESTKQYYIHNLSCGKVLRHHGPDKLILSKIYTNNTDNKNARWKWTFEHLGNNQYYIRSVHNNEYALYGSGNSVSLSIMPTNPSDGYIWEIQAISSYQFIIKNKSNQRVLKYDKENDTGSVTSIPVTLALLPPSTDDDYEMVLWDIVDSTEYVEISSINITTAEWINVGYSQAANVNVVPTNATYGSSNQFLWESDNPSVATVTNSGVITGVSAGTARIIVSHPLTDNVWTFVVTVGQIIPNGTYYIQNKATNLFVDIFSGYTSDNVVMLQNEYMNQNQEKWAIQYLGSGYYSIRSLHSNKYLSVYDSSNQENEYIVQTSTLTDGGKWKIIKTLAGNYKFTAKCAESNNLVLAVSDSTAYSNVFQLEYDFNASSYGVDNTQYNDEWNLYLTNAMFIEEKGIADGEEYFIMNVSNKKYMGLANQSSTTVVVSDYADNINNLDPDMQKWTLDKNEITWKYKFISSFNETGKVLGVTDSNLYIYTDNGQNNQSFAIQRINWAPYEGTYAIKYNNMYVSVDSNNNVVLNTSFDSNSAWSLMKTEKGLVDLFNFDYPGFDTTDNAAESKALFESLGYSHYINTNTSATIAYSFIQDDDVFIFRGHGGSGVIGFYNSSGLDYGKIYASSDNTNSSYCYLGSIPENSLSSLRCALFLGCSTGRTNSNGDNMLETAYAKGAHFALGTLDTTYTHNSNSFFQYFIQGIEDDYSIGEAVIHALTMTGQYVKWPTYEYYGYYPITYIGDIYQILH